MVDPRLVPADSLINELAEYIKENFKEISPPPWSIFVKTSPSRERLPIQDNWWYIRAAAMLRKLYIKQPLSVESFRTIYGGRKKFKKRMEHHHKASGAITRKILQQLEVAGLVKKTEKGRVLTEKGQSLVSKVSSKVFKEILETNPELTKYLPGGKDGRG
ncbi:MAG TPA: 30S ribosomal protein S19e [Geobacterales bacterium]|jgi:small subunit ribosomal protein S19e|nr:30S ribosomal protein S19e [Geobacterales bacterium]